MMRAFIPFEFDAVAIHLWQRMAHHGNDFAYQNQLATCLERTQVKPGQMLDDLKPVDVFLAAVKSNLLQKHATESELINHPSFARLMVILAIHAIKVLEAQATKVLFEPVVTLYVSKGFSRVYTHAFLGQETPLKTQELDDFYQGLAVVVQGKNTSGLVSATFLPLSVIGARLFGTLDRRFWADVSQSTPITEDSLYWQLRDFLLVLKTLQDDQAATFFAKIPNTPSYDLTDTPSVLPTSTLSSEPDNTPSTTHERQPQSQPALPTADTSAPAPRERPYSSDFSKSRTDPVATRPAPSSYKRRARASHTPKLFFEAYHDLGHAKQAADSVPAYAQASLVLDKFDRFIQKEMDAGKSIDEVAFGQSHESVRRHALEQLFALAKHGNTAAMLRLALYYFEGRGLSQDTQKALLLTKRSAEMGDNRAQKLLSRLYYQGYQAENGGVAMDATLGEHWLNKAADNGHADAQKIRSYIRQAELLKSSRQDDIRSDKRYGMLLGAVVVVALLIWIVLK